MFRETLEAGLGVVLEFLSEKVTLPPLVDDIEALVAVRAISFALDLGFSSIILEEDLRENYQSFAEQLGIFCFIWPPSLFCKIFYRYLQ